MPNLATQDDVRAALRRELTENEQAWIDDLLAECSDLVVGYLHPTPIPDPVPDPITRVTAAVAAAVLTRPSTIPPEAQSLTADVYGVTFQPGSTSPGPYLSPAFKQRLDPYRVTVANVTLGSDRY